MTDKKKISEILAEVTAPRLNTSKFTVGKTSMATQVEKPVFDPDDVVLNCIRDYDDPEQEGLAYWDAPNTTVTVFLPPHIPHYELNYAMLGVMINSGRTVFSFDKIGNATIDDSQLPACKFFVPSSAQMKEGSELPSEWRFANSFVTARCVNPNFNYSWLSPGPCTAMPMLYQCSQYSDLNAETDERLVTASDGTVVGSLSVEYAYPRIPTYTLTIDDKEETFETITEVKVRVREYDDANLNDKVSDKSSYFELVF